MLQGVVTGGTGRAAQLDFTNVIGKTGTSSNFRDAWFMGITGQYVAGVWLGNDDFTPMSRVTGGSFPAQTWHNFMVLAHDTDNIPQIPGIALHPVQVAEQERLAQLQKVTDTDDIPAPTPESVKDMSSTTRQILERIGSLLKEAPAAGSKRYAAAEPRRGARAPEPLSNRMSPPPPAAPSRVRPSRARPRACPSRPQRSPDGGPAPGSSSVPP